MDLDERVEPGSAGFGDELSQQVVVHGADDEQDRVGAEGAGLPHAVSVNHEVLAQHGRADAGGGHQVVVAAAEPRRLGQDRERGDPSVGVPPRQTGDGSGAGSQAEGRRPMATRALPRR